MAALYQGNEAMKYAELIIGNKLATPDMIRLLRERADDTFMQTTRHKDFNDKKLIPSLPDGLCFADEHPMILKIGNVYPHTDPWCGVGTPGIRRSLFWLLEIEEDGSEMTVFFGVEGHKAVQLKNGDYVIFDDSKEHFVIAESMWVGCAWQLNTI